MGVRAAARVARVGQRETLRPSAPGAVAPRETVRAAGLAGETAPAARLAGLEPRAGARARAAVPAESAAVRGPGGAALPTGRPRR